MFAKKARSLNYSRGHFTRNFGLRRSAAAARPSNDNQPVRLIAPRRRTRRPLLSCHWQRTAAGRLECHWANGAPDLGDEAISCLARPARHRISITAVAA